MRRLLGFQLSGFQLWRLWIVAILVSIGSATFPRLANAEEFGVVTIDLRPESGDVPTHLCVVSQAEGPRARDKLASHLGEALPGSGERPFLPSGWHKGILDGDSCDEAGSTCSPRVFVPANGFDLEDLHMACTEDTLGVSGRFDHARVLVVLLELSDGAPPPIDSLRLTGGVVTVGVNADIRNSVVTARSIGGHYLPSRRSLRAEQLGAGSKVIVHPISPRCRWFEGRTEGLNLREGDRERLEIRVHGQPFDSERCLSRLNGSSRWRIAIPASIDRAGSVEFLVRRNQGESGEVRTQRYATFWQGAWPRSLDLTTRELYFSWAQPSCVVANDMCPRAILDQGVECSATANQGVCNYVCESQVTGEGRSLSTPVSINFEHQTTGQRWTEILQWPNQKLLSYVPRDQVYLKADVSEWKTDTPGNRITHVEVFGTDGSARRYVVQDRDQLQVLVNGADCQPVRYRLIGDREFDEASAAVEGGELNFGEFSKTARVMQFNLTVLQGGGPAYIYGRPEKFRVPSHFVAQVQLAARFRPRSSRWARHSFEMRLGGAMGQWGYYGPEPEFDDERKYRIRNRLFWVRFLAEPAYMIDVTPVVSMSAGLGFGSSWPLRAEDTAITGRFNVLFSPSGDIRFAMRSWLRLMLQSRLIIGEKIVVAEGDGEQLERVIAWPGISWLGMYGLEAKF